MFFFVVAAAVVPKKEPEMLPWQSRHRGAKLTSRLARLGSPGLSVGQWTHYCWLPVCIMFVLVEMVDTVRIPPWDFHKQLNEAIAEELNKKLANKVPRNAVREFHCVAEFWIKSSCETWAFAAGIMR